MFVYQMVKESPQWKVVFLGKRFRYPSGDHWDIDVPFSRTASSVRRSAATATSSVSLQRSDKKTVVSLERATTGSKRGTANDRELTTELHTFEQLGHVSRNLMVAVIWPHIFGNTRCFPRHSEMLGSVAVGCTKLMPET